MTESGCDIDVDALSERLPPGWDLETDPTGMVVGCAPHSASGSATLPALFQILKDDNLWSVTWWPPVPVQEPAVAAPDRIVGVEERCIEWILEKIEASESAPTQD
ncbi:hypothetical protein ACLI4Q_03855 [Natrialbaceae archaeon A-CW1-1]